ncbi:MAG: biotin--[acetyl-CoA-carboxylase] ligase [Treponema sp.]|nr:biotin--[acetyl-CoA-carboxylase] ligase [Treponema sp.]
MDKLNITNPFNAPVYYLETVSSTMDISRKLSAAGEPHGTVITADFQEAGRGRIRSRTWEMEKNTSLPFTILLRYPRIENIPRALTLRTGLAVSLAIEDFAPYLKGSVFVKWPNDIMIGSKKNAGILCEADEGTVYLGIGINVSQKEFPSHLREKAASIITNVDSGTNVTGDRFILLEKVLSRLYNEIETPLENDWRLRLEKRLYKINSHVAFIDGAADNGREVKGVLKGIGNDGDILIALDGGEEVKSFFTGELKF